MNVSIRSEGAADVAAIEALTAAAFATAPHASSTEQFIINALRSAGQLAISLVAEHDATLLGHVAVSRVSISSGINDWYGLGPISVAPAWQGRGIGTQLMQQALAELRRRDAAGCVVLGDPRFYGRFGFKAEPGLLLPGVAPRYFQAMAFLGPLPQGTVCYHAAFDTPG